MTPAGNGNGRPVGPHESRKRLALKLLSRPDRRIEEINVKNEVREVLPEGGFRRYRKTGRQVLTVVFSKRTDK